jgi:hypothetical protein
MPGSLVAHTFAWSAVVCQREPSRLLSAILSAKHLSVIAHEYGAYSQASMEEDSNNTEKPPWEIVDRDRGIFTKDDREYLLDEKELEGQYERNTRYRIRQRIIQSLLDIALMAEVDTEDKSQIATDERVDQRYIHLSLFAFACEILRNSQRTNDYLGDIEEFVEEGIEYAPPVRRDDDGKIKLLSTDASVSIDLEERPMHEMMSDIGHFDDIDDPELKTEIIRESLKEHLGVDEL